MTDPARQPERAAPRLTDEQMPAIADPRVQEVYKILCDDDVNPPEEEHWEGFVARRIVAALSAPPNEARWVDADFVEHSMTREAVMELLMRFWREWPGGFEEIEAALSAPQAPTEPADKYCEECRKAKGADATARPLVIHQGLIDELDDLFVAERDASPKKRRLTVEERETVEAAGDALRRLKRSLGSAPDITPVVDSLKDDLVGNEWMA